MLTLKQDERRDYIEVEASVPKTLLALFLVVPTKILLLGCGCCLLGGIRLHKH